MKSKSTALLVFASCFVVEMFAAPTDSELSMVVSSRRARSRFTEYDYYGEQAEIPPSVPKIYQMNVISRISNRYANTTITSKIKNVDDKAEEATFSVVLPENAFISGFIMEVQGINYTAYVKGKEDAKKDYDQAVASGLGAAHVAVNARDSNRFTVSVNVEPETKAAFYLTYEQLLKRQDGRYEQVININPGQPVKDLTVEVIISESRKIIDLKAPPLRSGNEIGNDKEDLDPRADLKIVNDTAAIIKFSPNLERQQQLAKLLGTDEKNGLSGQFVVQYDVERDPQGGEVLIQDGYFVHFFAPSELAPLPKYVVFVLDTSSSMYNKKIMQLKEAMHKILEQLHAKDLFSLVEFNTNVKVWDLDKSESSTWYPTTNGNYNNRDGAEFKFEMYNFPKAYPVNDDNIKKAKSTVSELRPEGGTDIDSALRVGLHLVGLAKEQKIDEIERQPLIVFLTDGDPTIGVTDRDVITNEISEFNSGSRKSPVFALSFGAGADKKFLQNIALRNSGFSKHIYEAADASLQLQDFYGQISSPLLANVSFKYEPSVTSLTTTDFPVHFGGSEIVVSGWCGTVIPPPIIHGWGGEKGELSFKPPTVDTSASNIERLWAYLTVRQLLDKKEISNEDKEALTKKALDLALKYSFVTPLTSLVVVKPNATTAVDTEEAAEGGQRVGGFGRPSYPSSLSASAHFAPPVQKQPLMTIKPQTTYSTTTELSTTEGKQQYTEILTQLPWLKEILNDNGLLQLPSGNYKLGQNERITGIVQCPSTPFNNSGHCSLIHACPEVYSVLSSSDVLIKHFCVLQNEYAGVCCPFRF